MSSCQVNVFFKRQNIIFGLFCFLRMADYLNSLLQSFRVAHICVCVKKGVKKEIMGGMFF